MRARVEVTRRVVRRPAAAPLVESTGFLAEVPGWIWRGYAVKLLVDGRLVAQRAVVRRKSADRLRRELTKRLRQPTHDGQPTVDVADLARTFRLRPVAPPASRTAT